MPDFEIHHLSELFDILNEFDRSFNKRLTNRLLVWLTLCLML